MHSRSPCKDICIMVMNSYHLSPHHIMPIQAPPLLISQESLTPCDQFAPIPSQLLENLARFINLNWLETEHYAFPNSSLHHGEPSRIDSMGLCRGVLWGRGTSIQYRDGRG